MPAGRGRGRSGPQDCDVRRPGPGVAPGGRQRRDRRRLRRVRLQEGRQPAPRGQPRSGGRGAGLRPGEGAEVRRHQLDGRDAAQVPGLCVHERLRQHHGREGTRGGGRARRAGRQRLGVHHRAAGRPRGTQAQRRAGPFGSRNQPGRRARRHRLSRGPRRSRRSGTSRLLRDAAGRVLRAVLRGRRAALRGQVQEATRGPEFRETSGRQLCGAVSRREE
mmetsp:Transcript_12838/g.38224  ORF Transcript_12838/g.38224 Transcript_12838/m.38224 type:complete len:219 (-) Transcript_12838:57-713(-)